MAPKKKVDQEFHYLEISKEEFRDAVNEEFPIEIRQLESIIDRIHHKYPLIDKTQISLIVRAFFESLRDFLILGYEINFNKLLTNMKLRFFTHVINGKINPALRVKLKTPSSLRK